MKNIGRKIILLLILLLSVQSGISYAAERSPFEEPVNARDMYDYGRAQKRCTIIGIITTEKNGKVILKLTNSEATEYRTTVTDTAEADSSAGAMKKIDIKSSAATMKEGVITKDQVKVTKRTTRTPIRGRMFTKVPAVYSVNDRILIESNGILHEFTLFKIKNKSIVLKGKNGSSYEVEAR